MNNIRSIASIPLRLEAMLQSPHKRFQFVPQEKVFNKIQHLATQQLTTEVRRQFNNMSNGNIVPLTSDEVMHNPVVHVLNDNDFLLACIDAGNIRMIEDLCEYGFDPIPEQIVPQKLSDRTWTMTGSCRPDPLLYAIFRNRIDIAIAFLRTGRYTLDETFCFPLSTVWIRSTNVSPRMTCNIEISPLTVALMQTSTMEQTRENVKSLLKLRAKKEVLYFRHTDENKYQEDPIRQNLFNTKLEQYRKGYETFLDKCF